MEFSKLEIDASGHEYLVCYYDSLLKNWDEKIKHALKLHKIEKPISILCMPKGANKYER